MKDYIVATYWIKGSVKDDFYNQCLSVQKIIAGNAEEAFEKSLQTVQSIENIKNGYHVEMSHTIEG